MDPIPTENHSKCQSGFQSTQKNVKNEHKYPYNYPASPPKNLKHLTPLPRIAPHQHKAQITTTPQKYPTFLSKRLCGVLILARLLAFWCSLDLSPKLKNAPGPGDPDPPAPSAAPAFITFSSSVCFASKYACNPANIDSVDRKIESIGRHLAGEMRREEEWGGGKFVRVTSSFPETQACYLEAGCRGPPLTGDNHPKRYPHISHQVETRQFILSLDSPHSFLRFSPMLRLSRLYNSPVLRTNPNSNHRFTRPTPSTLPTGGSALLFPLPVSSQHINQNPKQCNARNRHLFFDKSNKERATNTSDIAEVRPNRGVTPHLHRQPREKIVPSTLPERLQLHVSRALVPVTRPRPNRALLDLSRLVKHGLEV